MSTYQLHNLNDIKVHLLNNRNLNDCDFHFNVDFVSIQFSSGKIEVKNSCFLKEITSYNNTFNEEIDFSKTKFKGVIKFVNAKFQKGINFQGTTFEKSVSFHGTHFAEDVDLSNKIFKEDVSFVNAKFQKGINFQGTTFAEDVDFRTTTFPQKVDFKNMTFNQSVDFSEKLFTESVSFQKTFFHSVVFTKVEFDNTVDFENISISNNMILRGTCFKKGVDFSLINFINNGRLNIFGFNMNGTKTEEYKKIPPSHKRETYRILKNQAIAQNDHINAIEFYKSEMLAYQEELKLEKPSIDKLIMRLNRLSSNFGIDPLRGVIFTMATTILFYSLYLFVACIEKKFTLSWNCNPDALGENIRAVLEFFNLTKWDYNPIGIGNDYNYAFIVLVIGRLFIGYGIYQTIQAFRKFGRKI